MGLLSATHLEGTGLGLLLGVLVVRAVQSRLLVLDLILVYGDLRAEAVLGRSRVIE